MPAADRRLSYAILLAMAAFVGYLGYLIASPFLPDIFFAICLAIAFHPLYQRIHGLVKSQAAAAFAATAVVLLLILIPLVVMGFFAAGEGRLLYDRLKQESASGGGWTLYLANLLDQPLHWISARTGMAIPDLREAGLEKLQALSARLVQWAGSLVGNLTSTIAGACITFFTLYFLFQAGDNARRTAREYLPLDPGRVDELIDAINASVVANVYGIAAVAGAQGLLTGIGFAIAGLPSPVIWGFVATVCSLIPVVGASLVWVPGAIALAFSGSYGMAIFLTVWGLAVVHMADNVIRPMMLSGAGNLSTLPVFFALLGGVEAFGLIGLFAGPVVLSVGIALIRILHEERLAFTTRGDGEASSSG